MQYARYLCGGLILAAFFWVAALFWLLSPHSSLFNTRLGLLVISLLAYLAAVACAYLFPAHFRRGGRPNFAVFGVGTVALLIWLAGGLALGKAFFC